VPEGDDIHALAARLHGALAGSVLTETDFRVPRVATTDLSGQTVARVRARGKHLLIETNEGQTIHTHLKMDGELRLHRARRAPAGHGVRLVLRTDRWTVVGSLLGILEVWPSREEPRHLSHLGPDVLGPDWDPDEAVHRLSADPSREIGVALVDQHVMAGPGNVYKSEACFLRGVHPAAAVSAVRDPNALVGLVKRLMEANRARPVRVTTGDTRPGRRLWVYGRAGQPCRRCGAPIERIRQGPEPEDRVTFLCPSCQPALACPPRPS